jgi:hypothetical protein
MAFSNQIHDINAGFGPAVNAAGSNGFGTRVFWLAAIPDQDVTVNVGAGTAEMHVRNLYELDYPDFNTSVGPDWQTNYHDATASFDVVWTPPVTRRVDVKDAADGFAGHFNENQATVTWSAQSTSGFSFTSELGNKATSDSFAGAGNFFAQLGVERNGVFFPQSSTKGSGLQVQSSASLAELVAVGTNAVASQASSWVAAAAGMQPSLQPESARRRPSSASVHSDAPSHNSSLNQRVNNGVNLSAIDQNMVDQLDGLFGEFGWL